MQFYFFKNGTNGLDYSSNKTNGTVCIYYKSQFDIDTEKEEREKQISEKIENLKSDIKTEIKKNEPNYEATKKAINMIQAFNTSEPVEQVIIPEDTIIIDKEKYDNILKNPGLYKIENGKVIDRPASEIEEQRKKEEEIILTIEKKDILKKYEHFMLVLEWEELSQAQQLEYRNWYKNVNKAKTKTEIPKPLGWFT
jgi:hypothetical protein